MSSKDSSSWVDPDDDKADLLASEHRREGQPEERLRNNAKCHDWFWIILWAVQLVVVLVIGFAYYAQFKDDLSASPTAGTTTGSMRKSPSLNAAALSLITLLIGISIILSIAYLLVVKRYAEHLIWASLIVFTVMIGVFLIYFCVIKNVVGIIICAIGIPLHIWYMYAIRDSIPFATNVLTTVVKVFDLWPSTIAIALGGLLLQAAWFFAWIICVVSIFYSMKIEFDKGRPESASNTAPTKNVITPAFGFAVFGLLLSFFWTSQVIKNIVHVTASGVMATWYFLFPQSMPEGSPVVNALRRACTTAFGSIVLASFVTAFVKALRWTFHLISSWLKSEETNCITLVIVCIIDCLLRTIEAIVEYINMYALSYVAIYGKSYFESAHLSWNLMTRRGLDAVVNDDLIGGVLILGALIAGGVCATFGAVFGAYVFQTGGDWRAWATIGFLLGFVLTLTVMSVIESAVVTLFVCLADDPAVLRNNKREVYDLIVPTMEHQWEGIDLTPMNRAAGSSSSQRSDKPGAHHV